ncbi:hypothetical protein [Lelliottia amnigena]|uniref:ParE family toxin-like protein n=1 Tax=Lelliottia amnigena TaxID=61646 RepID=UPI001ED8EA2A|nr:hypothetical protein [Lelliottia amnigena]
MILKANKHAGNTILNKTFELLCRYYSGEKVYKVIKPHFYFSVRVSRRWRLLSKDNGKHWVLMTHEKYNAYCIH